MKPVVDEPRTLAAHWVMLLLAPMAWAAALGLLFSMTDESCADGSRAGLIAVVALAIVLAMTPAPLAWRLRRQLDVRDDSTERAQFMLGVALGGSAIFTLVTLISAVPVFLLGACRT